MGSLKNGHVFANMLSFPRLGLMGAMPSKPLQACWDRRRGATAARRQEKVFALVVFGEKCSLRVRSSYT